MDTRTAAEVVAEALFEWFGAEWYYDSVTATDNADRDAVGILSALAAAGYTIAGPGQVVVDRETYDAIVQFKDYILTGVKSSDPLPAQGCEE